MFQNNGNDFKLWGNKYLIKSLQFNLSIAICSQDWSLSTIRVDFDNIVIQVQAFQKSLPSFSTYFNAGEYLSSVVDDF